MPRNIHKIDTVYSWELNSGPYENEARALPRVYDHVEMYVNHVDLWKIMHRFMSQNAPERKFVEIIHFKYFHKHVDQI